jgi:hypothetical protein
MDEALCYLKTAVDDQEFIRLTKTILRIIQNLLNDPDNAKFRTVRAGSKVCCWETINLVSWIYGAKLLYLFAQYIQKAGVPQLLEAIGFKLQVGLQDLCCIAAC